MRDRVSVQGLGARGCVIRGKSNSHSAPPPPYVANAVYWPVLNPGTAVFQFVVLVDFSGASPIGDHFIPNLAPAWLQEPDTSELFDGFTLEGGDIQLMFWIQSSLGFTAAPTNARITNCVFDMRDGWLPKAGMTISGPSIGIELAARFTNPGAGLPKGYHEQKVLIAQNTFVMGSWAFDAGGGHIQWIRCRPEAVGIIDVTDSACSTGPNAEAQARGVGSPGIFNNLFRTAPDPNFPNRPMAMLGIDASDTKLKDSATSVFTESNAFDPALVGSHNGFFFSAPKVSVFQGFGSGLNLFDCGTPTASACNTTLLPTGCAAATLPAPAVKIWNGGALATDGVDPCFVGEYMNVKNQVAIPLGGIAGVFHTDWRLVPNSPLADKGVLPTPPSGMNGTVWKRQAPGGGELSFTEPGCPALRSMDWDMECYGNPRTVGGRPDIGADETHGYIAAASYGNDSVSHNVPGVLSPLAAQGQSIRRLVLDQGANNLPIVFNGKAVIPSASPPAWTQPPGTLTPPITRIGLPMDLRTQWITFGNPPPTPTPWHGTTLPALKNYRPPWLFINNQPLIFFCDIDQSDDETGAPPPLIGGAYFASQLVMFTAAGVQRAWSNLQFEYR